LDFNHLDHRHGVSLMMADRAGCVPTRDAHRALASSYARRIADALRERRAVA
jgi:hypothetical protein